MITLSILGIIWGIFSYLKIKKECDQKNIDFNPLEVDNVLYFLGLIIGVSIIITSVMYICIKHLP